MGFVTNLWKKALPKIGQSFQRVEKVFSPRCASFSEPEEVQKNLD
jgi:hypothetical protein